MNAIDKSNDANLRAFEQRAERLKISPKIILKEMSESIYDAFDDLVKGSPFPIIFKQSRLRGIGLCMIFFSICLLCLDSLYKLNSLG